MFDLSLMLHLHGFVGHMYSSNHDGTVLSCALLFLALILTSVKHLDVLVLKKNLCSSHTALLCLCICIFMYVWICTC
jgi:hypothetical protein